MGRHQRPARVALVLAAGVAIAAPALVRERWKSSVGSTFEVAGGPAADNTMTTVDRTDDVGTTYLLFAMAPALHHGPGSFGAALEDNACSNTQPWTASLARYRPASVTPAPKPPTNAPATAAPARTARSGTRARPWVIGAIVAFAATGMLLARRGGRRRGAAAVRR